jgi:hypothetical protein
MIEQQTQPNDERPVDIPVVAGEAVTRSQRRSSRGRAGRGFVEWWMVAGVVVIVVLAGALVAKTLTAPKLKGGTTRRAGAGTIGSGGAFAAAAKDPEPTAVFAHMRKYGVKLHFPAVAEDMVGIGFHQAWNTHATDMQPELQVHPKDKYASTKSALAKDSSLKLFEMMSRGRGSSEYSAADCAVKPRAIVVAPVTGVVAKVKTYQLAGYGKDYQVEIKPDGAPGLRVVMIHIKDVTVRVGDRVDGGITPVATVRHLTGIDNQVNRYLPVEADHTHVQINAADYKLNEAS